MAKILKEMQELEAKNKETVDKMKTKNITDSKSYQVLKLNIFAPCSDIDIKKCEILMWKKLRDSTYLWLTDSHLHVQL